MGKGKDEGELVVEALERVVAGELPTGGDGIELVLRLMLKNAESRESTQMMLLDMERAAHARTQEALDKALDRLLKIDLRHEWLLGFRDFPGEEFES